MTHGEDTRGQILRVEWGYGPTQALAQRDHGLWRFTHLGAWRVVPEQRDWRGRAGKGISAVLGRILAEGLALLWQKQQQDPKFHGFTGENLVNKVKGREMGQRWVPPSPRGGWCRGQGC